MLKYRRNIYISIYSVILAFCLWMAAQVPYTHDDWDWGLPVGIQQLVTANLNARYAGNFLEVIMTRSEFCKTLILGAGYFLIPFLITEVVFDRQEEKQGRIPCFLLATAMFLGMDRWIWQQTCGWIAGYANFGISAVFMLLLLKHFLRVFDSPGQEVTPRGGYVWLLAVSVAAQLFLENIALYLFMAALLSLGIRYFRTKKFAGKYLVIFAGTVIGLLLIFSSSIYETLWSTGSAVGGYRQVYVNTEAGFGGFLRSSAEQAAKLIYHIWEDNLVSCMVVLILLMALVLKRRKRDLAAVGVIAIDLIWVGYIFSNHKLHYVMDDVIRSVLGSTFFVTVCAEVLWLFWSKKEMLCRLLAVWFSTALVILPLVVTSETGVRLFFSSNILMILFAAMLLRQCLNGAPRKVHKAAAVLLTAAVLLLAWGHGRIYSDIGQCKRQRDALIAQAIDNGESTISLPQYPHGNYLWIPNPDSEKRMVFFKAFYGIPDDVTVVFE